MLGLRRSYLTIVGSVVVAGGLVLGAARSVGATSPDLEFGAYLATECLGCHRHFSGSGASSIPTLYGMAEETLADILRAFRARQLDNPVMQNVAGRLKDDEIAALAAYFARTTKP